MLSHSQDLISAKMVTYCQPPCQPVFHYNTHLSKNQCIRLKISTMIATEENLGSTGAFRDSGAGTGAELGNF